MKRMPLLIVPAVVVVGTLAPAMAAGTKAVAPTIFTATSPAVVSIGPRVGPPTTTVSVGESGFGGQEAVDVSRQRA